METNDSLTDLVATFAPRINEVWGEVVATEELRIKSSSRWARC